MCSGCNAQLVTNDHAADASCGRCRPAYVPSFREWASPFAERRHVRRTAPTAGRVSGVVVRDELGVAARAHAEKVAHQRLQTIRASTRPAAKPPAKASPRVTGDTPPWDGRTVR